MEPLAVLTHLLLTWSSTALFWEVSSGCWGGAAAGSVSALGTSGAFSLEERLGKSGSTMPLSSSFAGALVVLAS
ncbi:hypothetical protein F5883DRAFT_531409 [Diaporthe sp. PMI_573]|nr:hypothetical protein F5883DRAFT_531409 [Diaporthaceae sp. PMI_573]